MFHCFDHEIVLEGMKEEISQQRGTIGAHWYTNNLPENRAFKTNVDVVDKKVNSETKLSTREVCVLHGRPIIRPEGAKRIGSKIDSVYACALLKISNSPFCVIPFQSCLLVIVFVSFFLDSKHIYFFLAL